MIKIQQTRNRRKYFNVSPYLTSPQLKSHSMVKRWKLFPKIRNNKRMTTLSLFYIVLEILARAIRQQKEIKESRLEKK